MFAAFNDERLQKALEIIHSNGSDELTLDTLTKKIGMSLSNLAARFKETVGQFIGNKESPFSSVALAQIFGNETLVSAFITDKHADGSYTVFVPTGPNPTSGNIFHLEAKYVYKIDVSVEDAMRSIISCGAGSAKLLEAMNKK